MINVAVVGLGYIAKRAAQGVKYARNANMYMAVSRDLNKAQTFANDLSIPCIGTFEDMLKDDAVDLVYLCTPNYLHYDQIETCFKHGKHVLCEKPMLSNSKDLKAIFECSRKYHCFLMEAEKTLFTPLNASIKKTINEGTIGDLVHIQADYSYDISKLNYPKDHWAFMKGHCGSMIDVGVYPIVFSLFHARSSIVSVTGFTKGYQDYSVDFFGNGLIQFENGLTANVMSSWLFESPSRGVSHIYGTKGYIYTPAYWKGNVYYLVVNGVRKEIRVKQDSEFSGQIEHCADCIEKGLIESPYFNEAMHLDILHIIESLKKI